MQLRATPHHGSHEGLHAGIAVYIAVCALRRASLLHPSLRSPRLGAVGAVYPLSGCLSGACACLLYHVGVSQLSLLHQLQPTREAAAALLRLGRLGLAQLEHRLELGAVPPMQLELRHHHAQLPLQLLLLHASKHARTQHSARDACMVRRA